MLERILSFLSLIEFASRSGFMRLPGNVGQPRMAMVGFHLPEGGLGHVERHDGAYRFVPEV